MLRLVQPNVLPCLRRLMLGGQVLGTFTHDVLSALVQLTFFDPCQHLPHRALSGGYSEGGFGPGWYVASAIREVRQVGFPWQGSFRLWLLTHHGGRRSLLDHSSHRGRFLREFIVEVHLLKLREVSYTCGYLRLETSSSFLDSA